MDLGGVAAPASALRKDLIDKLQVEAVTCPGMATEIERKFLVKGDGWRRGSRGRRLRQGYLSDQPERTVRVRIAGDHAWLTIKGLTRGCTRVEFEYPIPATHAERLLDEICIKPVIDKTRHEIWHGGHLWEVDEFHGANHGLVIAEIELSAEDEPFDPPDWLGEEVSSDPRYFNANLVRHPSRDWQADGSPEA